MSPDILLSFAEIASLKVTAVVLKPYFSASSREKIREAFDRRFALRFKSESPGFRLAYSEADVDIWRKTRMILTPFQDSTDSSGS